MNSVQYKFAGKVFVMPIEGAKEVDLHRDEPMPPGFSAQVVWFEPKREGGLRVSVSTVAALRRLLKPYSKHERLVVYLDRDGGESGSVWVHVTGDRAWVTHMTMPGGVDTHCRNEEKKGKDEQIGFWLSNGQEDLFHWKWTVPRKDGIRALEYFVQHGDRDPSLCWAVPRTSFCEPEPA